MEDLLKRIEILEDEICELKTQQRYSKEKILFQLLQEIYESCNESLRIEEENKRFNFESLDFEDSIKNLKKFIEKADEDYNLRLVIK